jgi:hypothetical protein
MEALLEVLKFTIPSLVVFATAYFLIKMYMDEERDKRQTDIRLNNQKLVTPLRLQAYDRIVLFLERINPQSLILRVQTSNMSAKRLHSDMLALIRAEFEHNQSQQIYMSPEAWEVTRNARENIVKVINTSADRVGPDAPALELSKIILETMVSLQQMPTSVAIDFIKKEISQFF